MKKKYIEVWENCLSVIKDNIHMQSFKTWFEPIIPIKLENSVLTIQVPSQFFTNGSKSTTSFSSKK